METTDVGHAFQGSDAGLYLLIEIKLIELYKNFTSGYNIFMTKVIAIKVLRTFFVLAVVGLWRQVAENTAAIR